MQHADLQNDLSNNRPPAGERRRKGSPMRAVRRARDEEEKDRIMTGKPVLWLLHYFAARMQGRSAQSVFGADQVPGGTVSREVLSDAAARLGLQVQYEPRDLNALKDGDFPCLVPLEDGTAFLATGLQNSEVLLVDQGSGVQAVPFRSFTASYSGLVLKLQPVAGEQAGREPETSSQGTRAGKSPGLTGQILHSLLADSKAQLVQLALAATLGNMLMVVLPLFIMSVYDRVIPHLAMETLWALALGVLLALAIDLGLRISRSRLLEAIAISISNRYQGRFYSRLMRLEMAAMPRLAGGVSAALAEFDQLCRIIPQAMIAVAIDLPFFILLLGLLSYMGGWVVVAPILGIIAIAAANMVSYAKSREVNAAATGLAHTRTNQLVETLAAIETIKATRSENHMLGRWERLTDEGAWLSWLARHQSGYASHLTIIIVQVTIVLTLIIGVYELRAGGMTMGALAASSLLVGRSMAPMGNLIALIVRGFHILRTSGVVEQILAAPQEEAGDRQGRPSRSFRGEVVFNSVSFSYEADQAPVIDNISLKIAPGERVGLIGRIGCGKSTLLKLLPRLQQPGSGSLLLDGHDIRQYDPAFLRHNMALMPQEAVLLEGSLRDNICFGLDTVSDDDFQRAVDISGVQTFAAVHPQGYGMQVGPRGEKLSGGERAGVVLARTLLRNPKMLLLDEPTAAMDNDLERRIVASLSQWLGNRSLILATHRAPLLALVDRIIWLHNGRIVADGPRNEILARLKGHG